MSARPGRLQHHRRIRLGGSRHDAEHLLHMIDVERRRALAALSRMVQQWPQRDPRHLEKPLHRKARRLRSISCIITGVRINCIARSNLLPGTAIEFARDIKLPCSIESR